MCARHVRCEIYYHVMLILFRSPEVQRSLLYEHQPRLKRIEVHSRPGVAGHLIVFIFGLTMLASTCQRLTTGNKFVCILHVLLMPTTCTVLLSCSELLPGEVCVY